MSCPLLYISVAQLKMSSERTVLHTCLHKLHSYARTCLSIKGITWTSEFWIRVLSTMGELVYGLFLSY